MAPVGGVGADSVGGFGLRHVVADAFGRGVERLLCRERGQEIAHFAEIVIAKHRTNRRIENWAGFLMVAVPKYFQPPAGEVATFRARRDDEIRQSRAVAWQILDDPGDSDECTIQWAKDILRGAPDAPAPKRLTLHVHCQANQWQLAI